MASPKKIFCDYVIPLCAMIIVIPIMFAIIGFLMTCWIMVCSNIVYDYELSLTKYYYVGALIAFLNVIVDGIIAIIVNDMKKGCCSGLILFFFACMMSTLSGFIYADKINHDVDLVLWKTILVTIMINIPDKLAMVGILYYFNKKNQREVYPSSRHVNVSMVV